MKKTKRLLSMVLTLGLILTMLSPVSFAEGDGTITVDNPKDGQTYTLYRVFDLIMSPDVEGQDSNNNTTYQYTANDVFKTTVDGTENQTPDYSDLNSDKTSDGKMVVNVTPLIDGSINPYDFSNWLSNLPDVNFVEKLDTKVAGQGPVQWTGLPLGYYMVKSTLGTLVSLNTTDKSVKIHEKNPDSEIIKLSKLVKGGVKGDGTSHDVNTNDGYVDKTYANIGEPLEYKITFNVHAYANKEYVLTDELPEGIELIGDPAVTDMTTDSTDVAKKYSYKKEAQTLTFTFSEDTIQAIAKSLRKETNNMTNNTADASTDVQTITITYTAKLNNSAEMSNKDKIKNNKNEVILTYDKDKKPKALTLEANADVRTTEFQIKKFRLTATNQEEYLTGAGFRIYDSYKDGNEIKVKKDGNNYYVNPQGDEISPTDANVIIKGLKPGTYYIEETTVPTGYNKIQDRIKLIISEDTANNPATSIKYEATIEGVTTDLTDSTLKIENQKGAELPETGGIGRTIIYTLGALLFFGALILLVARKKTKEQRA